MTTGNVFVISAPSGAGKSSLVQALCKKDNQIQVSISHTTRQKRTGDVHGIHYYFTQHEEFKQMLGRNEFLEYAQVYGNFYGTHKDTLQQLISAGKDIILEIDHQGALQIRNLIKDAVLVYIFPPSINELEKRLNIRNTDSPEIISNRLSVAHEDMTYAKYFDFAVINNDFNEAVNNLYSIIMVHRFKVKHILEQLDFLK